MAPLQRSPTRESILSWWSDSNSLGVTIPLHTLAKPLLKRLYHRQALGVISSSPLSTDKVALLTTYLTFKDISSSTRALVLDYLRLRAWYSEVEAHMIVDGNTLSYVDGLLQSSDPDVLRFTCRLLRNLAYYSSLQSAVLKLQPCMRLVSLLSHKSTWVQEEVVNVLACISAGSEDSARSVVHANVLVHSPELLASKNFGVRVHTCWMLGNIARHPALNTSLVELEICTHIGRLLHPTTWRIASGTTGSAGKRENRWVQVSVRNCSVIQRDVIYALACISAGSEHGARAVVNTKALVHLPQLLESPNSDVVRLTCSTLANVACHTSLNSAVLEVHPLTQILGLLKNESLAVRQEAASALRCIIAGSEQRACSVIDKDRAVLDWESGSRMGEIFRPTQIDVSRGDFWARAINENSRGLSPRIIGSSIDCPGL